MKLSLIFYVLILFVSCGSNASKEKKDNLKATTETQALTTQKDLDKVAQNNDAVIKKEEKNALETDVETTILDEVKDTDKITHNNSSAVEKDMSSSKDSMPEKTLEESSVGNNTVEKEETKKQEKAIENLTTLDNKDLSISKSISHQAWNELLKKYVDNKGNVNYKSFKNSISALEAYLDALAKNEPTNDWSKNEKLAYYINLYNAATVKLILDNYPTKSIKDIRSPWGKKIVKIGDKLFSLGHIEHKILRKMNEPRIHFAINCASYSCPKLVNTAFTSSKMEQQLDNATKDFINDTTRNQFNEDVARLSEIFKWYKGDFTDNGSLKDYINPYINNLMTKDTKIKYLDYDWNLNE